MPILFVIVALLGAPLFAIFGGLALHQYLANDLFPVAMLSEYYKLASQPVLLTIPLFTFAGYLLAESKAPERLVNLSHEFFGWMPGGLAVVTIISCAFFTAFTGASGVTIIALGGLMYPLLMKDNYGDKFAMGLVTCCGSVGLLFAPSLPLILYGLIGSVNIDSLFIAGILPSLVIILILVVYGSYLKKRSELAAEGTVSHPASILASILFSILLLILAMSAAGVVFAGTYWLYQVLFPGIGFSQFVISLTLKFMASVIVLKKIMPNNRYVKVLRAALWEIPLPILILVSIYGGYITASETAAVTAFYVLIAEVFIYRDVKLAAIPRIITESMMLVGGILIILGVAMGLTNFMIDQQVPDMLFDWVNRFITSKAMFLIVLNLFLLVVGCLMDIFSAIIVVLPLIIPIARKYGVNDIHLAMIFLTNLEIGYLTPPVGMNLFISSFRFKRPVVELYKISLPFLILLLVALMVITYVPWLSTGLLEMRSSWEYLRLIFFVLGGLGTAALAFWTIGSLFSRTTAAPIPNKMTY